VTVNLSCLLTIFLGNIVFDQPPITSVQLLWINMMMDLFAALALSTEPPHKSVLDGKPFDDKVSLLTPTIQRQILGISLYNFVVMTILMFFGSMIAGLDHYDRSISTLYPMPDGFTTRDPADYGVMDKKYLGAQAKTKHLTYIFNTFVFLQLFNMINCRKTGKHDFNVFESFFHNFYFILFFCLTFVIQYILIEWFPWVSRTVSLSRGEWGSSICVGATVLIVSALLKMTPESWVERISTDGLIDEDKAADNTMLD